MERLNINVETLHRAVQEQPLEQVLDQTLQSINAILGEERAIVSEIPGTTRDATDTYLTWEDQPVLLIDTAGMRKRAKVVDKLEKLSVADGLRAVDLLRVVEVERVEATLVLGGVHDARGGGHRQESRGCPTRWPRW